MTVTTIIPSPLDEPPPPQPFLSDFSHLLKAHLRVAINKVRRWPILLWIVFIPAALGFGGLFVYLGVMAYRTLVSVGPQLGGGLLSLAFLGGVIGQVFFGIPSAFVTLYMSEDLDILFASPVSIRAVFAVKSLVVAVSNFLPVLFFVILPGIFYALLFKAGLVFYLILLLVVISLWVLGTALAVFLNLFIMRIVPPHRSREAVGVISAVAGIVVAMFSRYLISCCKVKDRLTLPVLLQGTRAYSRHRFIFPGDGAPRRWLKALAATCFQLSAGAYYH